MLLRLLIWFALMAAVGWWIRRAVSPRRPNVRASAQAARRQGALAKPEEMIDCARCGLHLPASEALRDAAGRPYCCADHRAAGPLARG